LPQLLAHVRRIEPDVLIIQYAPHAFDRRGVTVTVNLLPVLLRLRTRTRVVTNFHELYVPFGTSPKHVVGALWQRAMALLSAASSHDLTVTTPAWSRRLWTLGVRKTIVTIPVGSNIPRAGTSDRERAEVRKRYLGSQAGLLFGVLGASHDRHIGGVLTAVSRLRSEQPTELVWIGGGQDDGSSRAVTAELPGSRVAAGDITWTGWLSHPQVSLLVSACDAVVLPFVDGISTRRTTAVTTLQHGVPLISTFGADPDPCFVHGESMLLVPAGDQQALVDALVDLAHHPELRKRLALNGRALYESRFTWDAIARQVARVAGSGLSV